MRGSVHPGLLRRACWPALEECYVNFHQLCLSIEMHSNLEPFFILFFLETI
jgi:hypothetical protein